LRRITRPRSCRSSSSTIARATTELIVSVDSDVVVDRRAVRMLVRRFTDPSIVAVGGRVNISNPHESWLTRMQTIKYYFGYEFLKSLERAFTTVMCLSGCLTAYRRSVLVELEPILENRNVLGVPIKYGEDRFLTRQIVKAGYRTTVTLDAICWTVAPNTLGKYFAQQLRWRRSNLVDYLGGLSHAWRLHPMVALHYFSMFALLVAYPIIVVHNAVLGAIWPLAELHLAVLAVLGLAYFVDTRDLPPSQRVHPLWLLGLGVLMPVTYLLYTPLALFTLDSSSWETRGHGGTAGRPPS
jgi:cellulose synthase/poly-beta-1,6-N-acetylglucosamine synthase-like glycosyltransferase